MAQFFSTVNPSNWSSVSVLVWLAVFVVVVWFVYRPSVRRHYEEYGKLPLDKE